MTRALPAALALALASAAATSLVQAPPAAAPAPAATSSDKEKEATRAWLDGYMSWGKGQINLVDLTQHKVPGWRLLRAVKKFEGRPEEGAEQLEAAFDDAGKTALIGIVFADDERLGKDLPVKTDADLAGVTAMLKRAFGPVRIRMSLDPATDLPAWKGAKLMIDTGYGFYAAPAHVSASDGGFVVLGRAWDRSRSIPEQRRQLLSTEDTPHIGPDDAKINVFEFSDMQCPSCKYRTAAWEKLNEKLGSSVKTKRWFKSYPLTTIHSWAFRAASAGRCFFQKDPALFLSWKAAVYARQEQLSVDALDQFAFDFAQSNGISADELQACYLKDASSQKIFRDLTDGFSMGVRSTPTYFVDGVLVTWWEEDTMEEFLRTTYLNGAGLPLPKKPKPTPGAAGH